MQRGRRSKRLWGASRLVCCWLPRFSSQTSPMPHTVAAEGEVSMAVVADSTAVAEDSTVVAEDSTAVAEDSMAAGSTAARFMAAGSTVTSDTSAGGSELG